ncbi:hypothetical protein [Paenibacillus sp. SI8]
MKCEMCEKENKTVGTRTFDRDNIIWQEDLCDGCFHEVKHDHEVSE